VLLVSSLSGLRSKYGSVLYCASKHAIVGFVKGMGLAEDLEGVKVVGICPG
jgi:NAD(P)-dependent dehydrogenase (short-subunit alcohol dehydrogenase family)